MAKKLGKNPYAGVTKRWLPRLSGEYRTSMNEEEESRVGVFRFCSRCLKEFGVTRLNNDDSLCKYCKEER